MGSVRLLTARDGTPAASYAYEPFGQARGQPPDHPYNPYRFAGMRFDPTLGTYDAVAREYDPVLGRFLERDPAGLTDGGNLYTYAANAPLSQIDPTGTEARPELTREQKKQAAEAYFEKYRQRLKKEEQEQIYRHRLDRKPVERVFKVYQAIIQEIQDATIADRDIDIQGLWHEHKFMDWEDRGWMHTHQTREEEPFADVGPFGGELVNGINVNRVFGLVTGSHPPKPSLLYRIFHGTLEAVVVFGPDIAAGMEFSYLRGTALREGMAAARIELRPLTPLTYDEYLSAVPRSPIALGTYGHPFEAGMEHEAMQLGYRTLGTSEADAARLGIVTPVPDSVRALGKEAIVEHEVEMFLKPAERIAFWLTGKEHEYENSITFMELKRIWDDPALYNKTEWLGNPAAVEWVKEKIPQTPGVVHHVPYQGSPPVVKLRLPE
jgi:RHS repeat-associated protein